MRLRTRMAVVSTALTAVALGGAFAGVSTVFNRSQERDLDKALKALAHEEARDSPGMQLAFSDRPGPAANAVSLPKFGVIYDGEGSPMVSTETFESSPPSLVSIAHPDGECFDFSFRQSALRGVFVGIPGHPSKRMLVATSRDDIDDDAGFLREATGIAFAVAVLWAAFVASFVGGRLTREHDAIVEVARKVAAGDLAARIEERPRDRELAQLVNDVNGMIERMGILVASQQQFIANAAHELRSPLSAVYGELKQALRKNRTEGEYRVAIQESLDSTQRLVALAEDLLALARLGGGREGPMEIVTTDALVAEAARAVEKAAVRRDVKVVVDVADGTTRGRPRDLERMIRNLLENAVRHSPSGGRVQVSAKVREDIIEIVVADEGPGVPAEDCERIFEPFFRGARSRAESAGGAGLGLGITREIARAHGGDVALEALVGEEGADAHGARFVVRLPTATKDAVSIESEPPEDA